MEPTSNRQVDTSLPGNSHSYGVYGHIGFSTVTFFLHTPKKTVATTQMRAETRDVPAAVKLGVAAQATTAPTTPPSSIPLEPYRLQSSSPAPTGQGTFIIDPLTPDDSPTSDYLSVPASEYMSAADDLSA